MNKIKDKAQSDIKPSESSLKKNIKDNDNTSPLDRLSSHKVRFLKKINFKNLNLWN